jgi:hypothetical protein
MTAKGWSLAARTYRPKPRHAPVSHSRIPGPALYEALRDSLNHS